MSDNAARESAFVEAAPGRTGGTAEPITGRDRARRDIYRYRFAVFYFLLATVVGGAIGSFVVLATQDGPPASARWSAWEPDGSETAQVRQIADQITRRYKEGGNQLVFALGGRPQVTIPDQGEADVAMIAVQPDTSRGQREEGEFDRYDADSAISYRLCGAGTACSIAGGSPSVERLQLLRREALELSLYTFKYVDGVDSVVVFLPPAPPKADGSQDPSGVLFLRRGQLADELKVPVTRTLSSPTPPIGGMPSNEAAYVDRITRPNIYAFRYQPLPDQSVALLLSPPTAA